MKELLIYTPQNGDILKTVLDATVTFLHNETFQSGMEIMMILAVCMTGYQYIRGKKMAALGRFIVTSFFVTYCLLGLEVPVAIIDMQTAEGAGESLTVDHVPLGLALPAAIISGMGYGITSAFNAIFHMPNELDYTKSGMVFGARTWLAGTNTRLSMSPDMAADMSTYIRQCIFSAKLLASQQISPTDLVHSPDLMKTYFDNPSPIYHMILKDGRNLNCVDAASYLKAKLPLAANAELARLSHLMADGTALKNTFGMSEQPGISKFSSTLEAAHQYNMGVSMGAANILMQNILINATRDAASDAFAFIGADAELMNYTNTSSMQKMHVAEANSFWLASYRLPYYMTVMWMLTICIFPLVVLISYLPTTHNVYAFYLQSQAYLWSWPPMFVIIHYFVSLSTSVIITLFGSKTGGVTFSTIDSLAAMHSNMAYTAGALAASVPFLAYYITKGLPSVLNQAAQHFGGMAQSMSVSEAQSAAQGNISMATYSGWNMNYENTNAHKMDTNYHRSEGRATVQTANGAMLSETANGARIGNVQPAISSAAVSVHGSQRVVDSLHQSANESFSNAAQNRTAGDAHLQAGLNEMKNFTATDTNDYRSGEGVSNTSTNSISQDLRKMKDAVTHYNNHHDLAGHVSLEGALSERVNTGKQILGKLVQLGTGTSIDASVTGRAQISTNHSKQWFNNSSDGQAFNEAFHHMVSTVQNNHLDTSDSHNLSQAEQIGAHIASSQSLLQQSSAEYAHGHQLQEAASHAQENASAIDSNLNQAYHDWVVEHKKATGAQVMLQTDAQSIATQQQWASDFLKSNEGHSAVSSEVKAALSRTGSHVHADYNAKAALIATASGIHQSHQRDLHAVDSNASKQGLSQMASQQLEHAHDLQTHHRGQSTLNDASKTKNTVTDTLAATDKTMSYQKLHKSDAATLKPVDQSMDVENRWTKAFLHSNPSQSLMDTDMNAILSRADNDLLIKEKEPALLAVANNKPPYEKQNQEK